ncbi:hypothetical protein LSH36_324g03003, partial [Paralvinella palmiformis]
MRVRNRVSQRFSEKWYSVLSKSRIFGAFSTLIGFLRCLEIILLCGSDHFMVNVS